VRAVLAMSLYYRRSRRTGASVGILRLALVDLLARRWWSYLALVLALVVTYVRDVRSLT
jgi:hypothetical protein